MNRTGIVHRVDRMGRVVLPAELRRRLDINSRVSLGISVVNGRVILSAFNALRSKSAGYVRRLDPLGRIVLPTELRRTLGIREGDPLEIFIEGDEIVLSSFGMGQIHEECCARMIANLDGLDQDVRGEVYTLVSKIRTLIKPKHGAVQGGR